MLTAAHELPSHYSTRSLVSLTRPVTVGGWPLGGGSKGTSPYLVVFLSEVTDGRSGIPGPAGCLVVYGHTNHDVPTSHDVSLPVRRRSRVGC
jgi:hypothetical protein